MAKTKTIKVDIPVYKSSDCCYIRVRDIKDEEKRKRFEQFMGGQTRPLIEEIPLDEQDCCFSWDYLHFLEIDQAKGLKKKILEEVYFD